MTKQPSLRFLAIFALAIPATLTHLSTPLLGLVDTMVIGRLNQPSLLAGIALGGVFFDFIFVSCNFLRSGTTGLVAQSQNPNQSYAVFLRAAGFALLIGLLIIVFKSLLLQLGLWGMGAQGQNAAAMSEYFTVRSWSAPVLLINYVLLGYLLGRRHSGQALFLQSTLNLCNIFLSLYLVLGLGWGVFGVAIATVISEVLAMVLGVYLLAKQWRKDGQWAAVRDLLGNRDAFGAVLRINRDIWLRSLCLLLAFMLFAQRSNQFGDVVLAANAMLEKLVVLSAYLLDGMATVAEQLVGYAVGIGSKRRTRLSISRTMVVSIWIAFLMSGLLFIGGSTLLNQLTEHELLLQSAKQFLPFAALAPLCGFAAYLLDGAYIGATWSAEMRKAMLRSTAVFVLLAFSLPVVLGNTGLWAALLVFLGLRGLMLWRSLDRQIGGLAIAKPHAPRSVG